MTAEEYLLWAEEQPSGRFELVDGEVVAMAPERVAHTLVKSRVSFALMRAIEGRGLDCQALVDGASVRAAADAVYEPDALVRCGSALPGDAIVVPDP